LEEVWYDGQNIEMRQTQCCYTLQLSKPALLSVETITIHAEIHGAQKNIHLLRVRSECCDDCGCTSCTKDGGWGNDAGWHGGGVAVCRELDGRGS